MPIVQLSNGQKLQFPDSMSREEMHTAIQKKFPANSPSMPETQENPSFWQKMGPGGEKYLSEDDKKKISNSEQQDMMNAVSMMAPFGQAGNLLNKGAGTLAKGAANIAGRIGQSGAYSGLESWAKDHGIGEGAGMGALFQTGLEGAIPGFKGAAHFAGKGANLVSGGKTAPFVDFLKQHLGINELKQNIQNVINEHILKQSKHEGGPRSPEEAKQLMEQKYTDTEGKQLPIDIGTLTGEPITSSAHKLTQYLPFSGTTKNLNLIQQKLGENEKQELENKLRQEQENISAGHRAVQEQKQDLANHINTHNEAKNYLSQKLQQAEEKKNSLESGESLQAPNEANQLLQRLGKGSADKEEAATKAANMLMEKHGQRTEESNQFFKHVFNQARKEKLYEHVDPLITTAMDKEMAMMSRIKGLNVEPLYQKFKNDPTIENGHWLKSELGTVIGDLERNTAMTPADRATIANIQNIRRTLETDIHDALSRHDKNSNDNLLPMYKKGVELHKVNVEPFRSTPELRDITINGRMTPKNIENIFNTPSNFKKNGETKVGPINKVLSDLSPEFKDLILFNKVGASQHAGNAENLVNALRSAKNEGHSTLFNPETKQSEQSIREKFENDARQLKQAIIEHKNISSELKNRDKKIKSLVKQFGKIKEAPSETNTSKNLINQIQEHEKQRLERESAPSYVPKATKTSAAALSYIFPKVGIPAILAGKPIAELLRDPKMLDAYMKRQPLEVKKSIMTILKENAPRVAGAYTQGSNNGT